MERIVEIAWDSLCKHGEELCGDWVKVVSMDEDLIVVLSDGLGSGVKANILATLTAQIAAEMLQKGASIDEVVETLVETLPECQVRHSSRHRCRESRRQGGSSWRDPARTTGLPRCCRMYPLGR